MHPGQTAGDETRAAFGRRSIPAKQPVMKPARRSAGDASRLNRVASRRSSLRFGRNTPGIPSSRALSAGRLASLGAHAGSTTGCYPRRCAPLIVAFRSKYTRASSPGGGSSLTRLVSRASRPHREDWPTSALTRVPPPAVTRVAARRSSLRFGRNTLGPVLPVGAPPSRALSAGRLAPTGRTGQPRRSPGFHHRLLTASLRAALRCVSVGIHAVFLPHAPCQPDPHRENWASPLSALTRVPPQAVK